MARLVIVVSFGVAILASPAVAPAQERIQRGRIQSVEAESGRITIATQGKDLECLATPSTRLVGPDNRVLSQGIRSAELKAGVAVMFRLLPGDPSNALEGLRVEVGTGRGTPGSGIRRGRIKAVDLEKKTITLTLGGRDRALPLAADLQVLAARGSTLGERLREFKAGSETFFKTETRAGTEEIVALKRVDGTLPGATIPRVDTSPLKPLTDLGAEEYRGVQGGLYPGGRNARPAAHESAGRKLAGQVRPLGKDGRPDPQGKIVLLSVGMSNTTQEFSAFQRLATADPATNPKLVLVDGAQGGMTAFRIKDPDDHASGTRYWGVVDERLRAAGVSREQVQVAWIKQADAGPNQGFPAYARTLQAELRAIVQGLARRFPNMRLVYLSSRTYGGFARTPLNPEPYAYESGLSVKWLIEEQLNGDPALNFDPNAGVVRAPWLSWGPYLWANGKTPRGDGFFYEEADFGGDGTHPSASGQRKVAGLLLRFFQSDPTAAPWFRRDGRPVEPTP